MPFPLRSEVHIDQLLSDVAVAYETKHPSLARQVFPKVTVDEQSNSYITWDKGDFHRNEAQIRAPGTLPVEINLRSSTSTYLCREISLMKTIPDELTQNSKRAVDIFARASAALSRKIQLYESIEFITKFMTTTVWGSNEATLAAGDQFSNASSDPIGYMQTLLYNMTIATGGLRPNVWVMSRATADALRRHPSVQGKLSVTQLQTIPLSQTATILSQVFDIEQTIISEDAYNVAGDGLTTSMSAVMPDAVLVAYKQPSPSNDEPSAGYTFSWTGFDGANEDGAAVKRGPDPDWRKKAECVVANSFIDQKVVAADCGYLLLDVLA